MILATIELYLNGVEIKVVNKEFKDLDSAKMWLLRFKSDYLIIGYTSDGSFGVVL